MQMSLMLTSVAVVGSSVSWNPVMIKIIKKYEHDKLWNLQLSWTVPVFIPYAKYFHFYGLSELIDKRSSKGKMSPLCFVKEFEEGLDDL